MVTWRFLDNQGSRPKPPFATGILGEKGRSNAHVSKKDGGKMWVPFKEYWRDLFPTHSPCYLIMTCMQKVRRPTFPLVGSGILHMDYPEDHCLFGLGLSGYMAGVCIIQILFQKFPHFPIWTPLCWVKNSTKTMFYVFFLQMSHKSHKIHVRNEKNLVVWGI